MQPCRPTVRQTARFYKKLNDKFVEDTNFFAEKEVTNIFLLLDFIIKKDWLGSSKSELKNMLLILQVYLKNSQKTVLTGNKIKKNRKRI